MAMPQGMKAIDGVVRLNPADSWKKAGNPSRFKDADSQSQKGALTSYLFPGVTKRMHSGATPDEMVELMHQAGIERGILQVPGISEWDDPKEALEAIEQHPDVFVGLWRVDPNEGMEGVRKLERMVKTYGLKGVRLTPHHTLINPNDKRCYPIYAKCIELDIPVEINVGIPGPRVPGEHMNPIYLDEVCWFFPELKVVMTYGGEPWQFTCVKLMLKWPNLYYQTAAFAPKYYPQEIVQYMNTRGADKIMFATGYPDLPFDRCMNELKDLALRDHVWPKFLRENTIRVFKLDAWVKASSGKTA